MKAKLLISIVLISLILFGGIFFFTQKSVDNFLSFKAYDSEGNLISRTKQSVLEGTPGVSSIDMTVTLVNTGTEPLSCNLISLTPSVFNNAMIKSSKTLPANGKVAWTSNIFDISKFESETTPTEFTATARCSYNTGTEVIDLPDKTGHLSLFIQPELGTTDFDVSIDLGGVGTEFCGDNICQTNENAETCPNDCAISSFVKFRTTSLGYLSGSAIAYTQNCGSEMDSLGFVRSKVLNPEDYHQCTDYLEGLTYVMDIPGQGITNKLYREDEIGSWICIETSPGSFTVVEYATIDTDASKVDISIVSFDSSKEVGC